VKLSDIILGRVYTNKDMKPFKTESAGDARKADLTLRKLLTAESIMRKHMYTLKDRMQADIINHKLMAELEKSYMKNITQFMRDVVRIVRKIK
jgi:hypothetical protein